MDTHCHTNFMTDFERTEYSDSIFAAIGRCLAIASRFESGIKAVTALVDVRATPTLIESEKEFSKFLSELERRSLFTNIKRLNLGGSDIETKLQAARVARNEVAHEAALGLDRCIDSLSSHEVEGIMARLRSEEHTSELQSH